MNNENENALEVKEEIQAENSKLENEKVKENSKVDKKNLPIIIGVIICFFIISFLLAVIIGFALVKGRGGENKNISQDKTQYKSEYRMSGNSLEDFDLYFLKAENKEKNRIYSPLSIKYALAMLAEGANGDSKEQIVSVIGDYKTKKYTNSDHMSFANAMFVRNSLRSNIKDRYTNTLQDKFFAEVKYEDFSSASPMNNWVSDKTFGLIQNLLDDDTVGEAEFFLINALGIDMYWNNQIHCLWASREKVPCINNGNYSVSYLHEKLKGKEDEYSYHDSAFTSDLDFPALKFNEKDNIKSAPVLADYNRYDIVKELGEDYIRQVVGDAYREWLDSDEAKEIASYSTLETDVDKYLDQYLEELNDNYGKTANSTDFLLYENDNVKAFAKDLQQYDGVTLQYIGIMPKKDQLTDYVKNVQAKDINDIIRNLKELKIDNFQDGVATIIRGKIPFFHYDYELDLLSDLQKLGIEDVFDQNKADLSNMLNDSKGHYIFDARHKANIEFSNEGIKAAAATSMGGAGAAKGPGFNYLFEIPYEYIDITFDQPYMYIIRDKDSGEVWFTGAVYEPEERSSEKPVYDYYSFDY